MVDYKVHLNVFEGPLDLLLYLIKKEEVDIYEVNLTKIATQFIEYVEMMRRLDLDVAGEFLVMAATLMYIKSRELLPVHQQVRVEGEENSDDPRWDLIRQLVEYKKFKDMAAHLQDRETEQENTFIRKPGKPVLDYTPVECRPTVTLLDLLNAVGSILRRFEQKEDFKVISEDRWSVSDKITLLSRLVQDRPRIKFSELFESAHNRSEVVVTFLALLELVRLKRLEVIQPEPFGDIEIAQLSERKPENSPSPSGVSNPSEPDHPTV